ncbi:MAG TPA: hypothetical protein VER96_08400 [Polyangiaceae bacterium]|nr:hypothetical protein [Polyangiaceae bacterium]
MTADDALLLFLHVSLGAKRERVLDFVRRPKARSKFLDLLYHQLGGFFGAGSIVAQLPAIAWNAPAFRFSPPSEFGTPAASLRHAYDEGKQNELVVTADGRYGYWRDETYVDSETLVIATVAGSRPVFE